MIDAKSEAAQTTNVLSAEQPKERTLALDVFKVPRNCIRRIFYFVGLPLSGVFFLTVPDCRMRRFRNLFWLTFIMSSLWIAVLAYVMVWMIVIIGSTLNIPDSLTGVTFVGFGASAADFISSVIVVRQGKGDMAICNALGSNVFDVLVCLGAPWLVKSLADSAARNDGIPVYSAGLIFSTLMLIAAVLIFLATTGFNNWKMDKKYGVILLITYFLFMVLVTLYEMNVFGYVNPPKCLPSA